MRHVMKGIFHREESVRSGKLYRRPVNGVIAAVSVLASSESIFISTDFQRDCVQAEELSDQFPLMSTY